MKFGKLMTSAGAIAAAVLVTQGAAAGAAVVPLTLTPGTNALTFTFLNNDTTVTACQGWAYGPSKVDVGLVRVSPRSTATVTYVDVSAGNYNVKWVCDNTNVGDQFVVIPGANLPGAKPHRGSATDAPATPQAPVPSLSSIFPTGSLGS
jgi:uncharacterized protein (DUF2141 family)